jgi:hypothetical protein
MALTPKSIPVNDLQFSMQTIAGQAVPLVANVTLTAPTSATLVTGLTALVTIPQYSEFLKVILDGSGATVTAAATITEGVYTGATAGALTTLVNSRVIVAPTGGTTVNVGNEFLIPVTPSQWGTQEYISIAATASTGNFVLSAASTSPTYLVVSVL